MCWSLEVSLGSYAAVCALSALLWRRNWRGDRWYAALLGFVGQIQACEAALWLDPGCTGLNQAASVLLLGVICCEPAAHAAIALALGPAGKRPRRRQAALLALSAAFGLALAAVAARGAPDWCARPCAAPACGRHLRWSWTAAINDAWRLAFFTLLAAPLAFLRPVAHAAAGAAYAAATFSAAHYLFNPYAAFESMWCWLAVGAYAVPLLLGRPPARRQRAE
jgi:hypothetical protein